jgi:hypothetical protein
LIAGQQGLDLCLSVRWGLWICKIRLQPRSDISGKKSVIHICL